MVFTNRDRKTQSRPILKIKLYNGEFDPGSGLTLAAGLIHASRGAAGVAILAGDRRTGA